MDKELNTMIKQIYYSPDGYQSIRNTYLQVKQVKPDIKYDDVKKWFETNIQRKTKEGRGFNSFVAPEAYHEYAVDLFFITDKQLKNQEYNIGMLCIDVFSKYMTVVPLKTNKSRDFVNGLLKCFEHMGKQPEVIYSDSEGALFQKNVRDFLEDEANIQVILTTTHNAMAERAIRTFKSALFKRIERQQQLNKQRLNTKTNTNIQWVDYIEPILRQYNNTVHSSTMFKPVEARKKSNEIDVKQNLELRARHGRKYPEIKEGDYVRILRNKKLNEKENVPPFRNGRFKIDSIETNFGQQFYKINGAEYIRSDLVLMKN